MAAMLAPYHKNGLPSQWYAQRSAGRPMTAVDPDDNRIIDAVYLNHLVWHHEFFLLTDV
jgi:hypothetical protein